MNWLTRVASFSRPFAATTWPTTRAMRAVSLMMRRPAQLFRHAPLTARRSSTQKAPGRPVVGTTTGGPAKTHAAVESAHLTAVAPQESRASQIRRSASNHAAWRSHHRARAARRSLGQAHTTAAGTLARMPATVVSAVRTASARQSSPARCDPRLADTSARRRLPRQFPSRCHRARTVPQLLRTLGSSCRTRARQGARCTRKAPCVATASRVATTATAACAVRTAGARRHVHPSRTSASHATIGSRSRLLLRRGSRRRLALIALPCTTPSRPALHAMAAPVRTRAAAACAVRTGAVRPHVPLGPGDATRAQRRHRRLPDPRRPQKHRRRRAKLARSCTTPTSPRPPAVGNRVRTSAVVASAGAMVCVKRRVSLSQLSAGTLALRPHLPPLLHAPSASPRLTRSAREWHAAAAPAKTFAGAAYADPSEDAAYRAPQARGWDGTSAHRLHPRPPCHLRRLRPPAPTASSYTTPG